MKILRHTALSSKLGWQRTNLTEALGRKVIEGRIREENPEKKIRRKGNMAMQNDKMKKEIVAIAISLIKMRGAKLVGATTQDKEARQEEDHRGDPEVGFSRVQTTFKCLEMINFMPLKDSGLVIKTPFRRREDVETNEDKEVAFVRTQSQDIEIIRFMDLRNGALVMEAIFNLKWDVEVKAVEGVNRNQNRSQRIGDEVGDGVAISRSNIKSQEILRRVISSQMLKTTLNSCKDNQTNEMQEEEILKEIRCIQYP